MLFQSSAPRGGAIAAVAAIAMIGTVPSDAMAQGLLGRITKTVKRSVESEIDRKAEKETRNAARCVLGEAECADQPREEMVEASASNAGGATAAMASDAQDLTAGPSALISVYPGSVEQSRDYQDYTDYPRVIGMEKDRSARVETIEGALTRLLYRNPKGRSTLELIRNYRSALEARGFQVDYEVNSAKGWISNIRAVNGMTAYSEDVRYFTGRLRYGEGIAYVSILVYREGSGIGGTNIHVLQTKAMDADMVGVDPSAMAAELERSGEVNLRGVFFDTGLYALRPESGAELDVIAALMASQPELAMDVVGHTDSTGSQEGNQLLSTQRAGAVRDALIVRGVAPQRLRALGMGSSQPIASNATEEGRAQNRRVMLVRR